MYFNIKAKLESDDILWNELITGTTGVPFPKFRNIKNAKLSLDRWTYSSAGVEDPKYITQQITTWPMHLMMINEI